MKYASSEPLPILLGLLVKFPCDGIMASWRVGATTCLSDLEPCALAKIGLAGWVQAGHFLPSSMPGNAASYTEHLLDSAHCSGKRSSAGRHQVALTTTMLRSRTKRRLENQKNALSAQKTAKNNISKRKGQE